MMSLKNKLLSAMTGSTSQSPVDISKLYLLGPRKQVESALLELQEVHAVSCCKIIRQRQESIVWWLVGGMNSMPHSYGR